MFVNINAVSESLNERFIYILMPKTKNTLSCSGVTITWLNRGSEKVCDNRISLVVFRERLHQPNPSLYMPVEGEIPTLRMTWHIGLWILADLTVLFIFLYQPLLQSGDGFQRVVSLAESRKTQIPFSAWAESHAGCSDDMGFI